jgi:hypothetical protein
LRQGEGGGQDDRQQPSDGAHLESFMTLARHA